MQAIQLEQLIHKDIPLTREMQLKVIDCGEDSVSLSAPLECNRNHQNTAFGGSLFSLAVLSGWCLLLDRLDNYQLQGNIVIQDSEIKYLLPVEGEIIATCRLDKSDTLKRFIKMYQRKGMARIQLKSEIQIANQTAVEFSGHYVVHQMVLS